MSAELLEEIKDLEEALKESDQEVRELDVDVRDLKKQVSELENEIEELKDSLIDTSNLNDLMKYELFEEHYKKFTLEQFEDFLLTT